jgi:hypothetical protein
VVLLRLCRSDAINVEGFSAVAWRIRGRQALEDLEPGKSTIIRSSGKSIGYQCSQYGTGTVFRVADRRNGGHGKWEKLFC